MEDSTQRLGREAGVAQGQIEAIDRPAIHIPVLAVAAVEAHDEGLVPVGRGVGGRAAEGLRPIGGETLDVVVANSTVKGMADDLVGHDPLVPGLGEPAQSVDPASGLVDALRHGPIVGA